MAGTPQPIIDLQSLRDQIRDSAADVWLLHVDLVGSTPYKTRHGEDLWIARLFDFYTAIERALKPHLPTKYLGDGILACIPCDKCDADALVGLAVAANREVSDTNAHRSNKAEHIIRIRTILGGGKSYLYEGSDPQGTPVDTLFRMEKFVPDGCIGLLRSVKNSCSADVVRVGGFRLKGLSGDREPLWVLSKDDKVHGGAILEARRNAALYDYWDLGRDAGGSIRIINGLVPELDSPANIQLGDIRAEQLTYRNLVSVGRAADVEAMTTGDFLTGQHERDNLICIGGPYYNSVTRILMRELKLPLSFDLTGEDDATPLVDARTNTTFCVIRGGNRVTKDYGFFVRAANPYNADSDVIIASGIETHAVAGIVSAFSVSNPVFMDLYARIRNGHPDDQALPPFYAVMPFIVESTGNARLPSTNDQTSHICIDWDRDGKWECQGDPEE